MEEGWLFHHWAAWAETGPDPCPTAVTTVGLCSEAGTPVSCPLSALAGTRGEGATGVGWGLVGATQAAAELGRKVFSFLPVHLQRWVAHWMGPLLVPHLWRGRQIGERIPQNRVCYLLLEPLSRGQTGI